MMPAAKHFDIVLGVDVHLVVTPPAPPLPIPHPFIGMVFDPSDFIPLLGATVWVNGFPRAQAGTSGKNSPAHIPLGAKFVMPTIANEGEVYMGSATVLAEDEPLGFMALPVLSCNDVGMPAPLRPKKKTKKSLFLPTSVVLPIPMGQAVLVGGPPTISLSALAFKVGLGVAKRLGKGIKGLAAKVRKYQQGSPSWKSLSNKIHDLAEKAFKKLPENVRNRVHRAICAVTGHPVDIATGKVFTEHVDFELPGPLPLRWERVWYSVSAYQGPLGHGWHHGYDLHVREDAAAGTLVLRTADGRNAVFPALAPGEDATLRQERLTLRRDAQGYVLHDAGRLAYRFAPAERGDPHLHLLGSIADPAGHQVRFDYTPEGHLALITDSAGRRLPVQCDAVGRIRSIRAPHPDHAGETFPLVRYGYDGHGNLAEVRDALDQPFCYRYANHLLVQETNRNGLNFYFEYDGTDTHARCLRTWGDGGIYNHKLTYFPEAGYTVVENSLGHRSTYHYNDDGLVYRTVDPRGHETRTQYDEACQVVRETDERGQSTFYAYDERGNRTAVTKPDGSTLALAYDDHNQLTGLTNETGAQWQWTYDEAGQLLSRVDPLGRVTGYRYAAGQLAEITDALGGTTALRYDAHGNVTEVTTPDGVTTRWAYDALGRCRQATDPKGNAQQRTFDLLGQLTWVYEPDGNARQLRYDGEGNVIHARDQQHDVRFEYAGMGRMTAREEAGTRVEFRYDTEEQLTALRNEHGNVYTFELDERGEVVAEKGFDGLLRRYGRDEAGRVAYVERPGGLRTEYDYDDAGRIVAVRHADGTGEQYRYRADGELLEAANAHGTVQFERDPSGQVLREKSDAATVVSQYDALGRRVAVHSTLGAQLAFARNRMGDVEKVSAEGGWEVGFRRDELGLELERLLPGGLRSQWQRDRLGRPTEQRLVTAGGNVRRTRTYTWDVNDRLRQITDGIQGITQFEHDAFGNLAAARYGDGQTDYRMPDAVGNLFRRGDRGDRKYGPAGQLLEAEGTRYRYDAEGNLVEKREPGGQTWHYAWNAAGMLARVTRPDGQDVSFTYDALGRRLSKTYRHKTTRWVWDGNVPLHEWTEKRLFTQVYADDDRIAEALRGNAAMADPANPGFGPLPDALTTWVFEPESFSPVAKLSGGAHYSIVTDHLGTPLSMFSDQGEAVWQMELSVYGEVRELKGWRESCPFRYPGQYEDVETGLYYNRFRYYDPGMGMYISQDPIGLMGSNPNIYALVKDTNIYFDPFGLECWSTARKKFWKAEAKANSHLYSKNNLDRMRAGKAPKMTVEVINRRTGKPVTKDVSMELHHVNVPQRTGGPNVHNTSNLAALTPWKHEEDDLFRHTGEDLVRVVKGLDNW